MIFIGVYQKAVRSKWWQCQQYSVLIYIKETSTYTVAMWGVAVSPAMIGSISFEVYPYMIPLEQSVLWQQESL